jgi:hypothetical protein
MLWHIHLSVGDPHDAAVAEGHHRVHRVVGARRRQECKRVRRGLLGWRFPRVRGRGRRRTIGDAIAGCDAGCGLCLQVYHNLATWRRAWTAGPQTHEQPQCKQASAEMSSTMEGLFAK